ncbi:MAG: hypothetical protein RDU20_17735, partial [Desulfomonilaceae bacterium]|nr:hypothetical protein [Desulfomonilaceae bacterium]
SNQVDMGHVPGVQRPEIWVMLRFTHGNLGKASSSEISSVVLPSRPNAYAGASWTIAFTTRIW